jgi:hypothetical protein
MTENYTTANWQKLAGTRQGIINKLEKRLARTEAEVVTLKASLNAANARLALYDHREAA